MKCISPKAISLKSTSVAADENTEWSASSTYGLNDIVKVSTAFPNKLYKSIRSNNLNRSPAEWLEPITEFASSTTSIAVEVGSKTFTIETGKSFSPGMEVAITRTTTPKSVAMSCEVESYNTATGELVVSVYSVIGTGTYAVWTIASADKIGFWEELGTTNAHAMFDEYLNTRTSTQNDITIKLNTSGVDGIGLLGLTGSSVEITLWNAAETESFWTKTVDLIYGSSISASVSDWYEYFFGVFSYRADIFEQISVLANDAVLVIKINALADIGATCGICVVGRVLELGKTQYGVSPGIIDYSSREELADGRVHVKKGYWAKRSTVPISIDNAKLDYVYSEAAKLIGIPTIWDGNGEGTSFESLISLGILSEFDPVVPGPSKTFCTIAIEGLI